MDVTWFAEKPLLKINLSFILHNFIAGNSEPKLDRQQQSKAQSRQHQMKVGTENVIVKYRKKISF